MPVNEKKTAFPHNKAGGIRNMEEKEKKNESAEGQTPAATSGKKKKTWVPWVICLAVIICLLIGIFFKSRPVVTTGNKSVTLTVADKDGSAQTYEAETDAAFLSDLMTQLADTGTFSYEASSSSYGLYIETVNGTTADYAADGAYWAIYVNGEYGQYAADAQPVQDGDSFELKYETGQGG